MTQKEDKYSLTYPQKNIWLVDKFYGDTAINIIAGTLDISRDFNVISCEKAINKLIELNDGLRINISLEGSSAIQKIAKYKKFEVDVFDMTNKSEKEIKNLEEEITTSPMKLEDGNCYYFALISRGNGQGTVVAKLHHIISDAWTFGRVATSVSEYIEMADKNEKINEIKPSYVEYINSEKEYILSDKRKEDKEFWENYLSGINEVVGLKEETKKISAKAERYSIKLDKQINDKIVEYAKINRLSPYIVFMTALAIYIHRTTFKQDFIIGTPVLNRSNFKEKQMMGMFVSTMPVRYKINEKETFSDMCKKNASEFMTLFRHQKYPYSLTLEEVHKNTDIKDNLYKVVLSYQNAKAKYADETKYSSRWLFSKEVEDDFAIHIMDINSEGTMHIHFDYRVDLFEKIEVKYISSRILAIIEDGIDNNKTIENIEIMTKKEKNKILYDFNDTYSDYPRDKTIQEIFTENAQNTPDKIAIIYRNQKLTYKELEEKSNQVANEIRKRGIKPNETIAIMMGKCTELMIGILATLKSSAAYVPIDNELPKERINYMLKNSNVKYIISKNNINCLQYNIPIINIDLEEEIYNTNNIQIDNINNSDDLAYIMYTSGTTGKPKGAMMTHKNVIKLNMGISYLDITKIENIFISGNIIFDASMHEMWLTYLNGKTGILIDKDVLINPIKYIEILKKIEKSLVIFTTQLFHQYSKYYLEAFDNVIYLIAGGDKMLYEYTKNIVNKCKNTHLINIYGPTECTAAATTYLLNHNTPFNIPIGKPIDNTKCYILDNNKNVCPISVEGELYIGGEGVGKGYINNEKLNKTFFMDIKINGIKDRVYKSGDIVKWNNDGNISFVGRKDNQIKIRGYRIEINEIENYTLKYDGIEQVYVKIENAEDNKWLSMFIVANINININDFKKYLLNYLPSYMIPKNITQIDHMPLTPAGKINKSELTSIYIPEKQIVLPKTELESNIIEIVKKLLAVDKVSIEDDIFEIGIDSIMAIKLISMLENINIKLKYSDLYSQRTINKIATEYEKQAISENSKHINEYDYSNINQILKKEHKYNILKENDNIIITGVTGFLGSHILKEFLDNKKGYAYCIVRDTNEKAEKRLEDKLKYYFGSDIFGKIKDRIKILNYDIISEKFNKDIQNIILQNDIKFIINAAATVKHYGKKSDFVNINVIAVENLIKACKNTNIRLIQISTLSVSGNGIEGGFVFQNINKVKTFSETDLYINQEINNVYTYTKYVAEIKILEEIKNGLSANIIRVGNLMGRYSDGKFQQNKNENGFIQRINFMIKNNIVPKTIYKNNYLEFSPIDITAKIIIELLQIKQSIPVYHLYNYKHVKISTFVNYVEKILKSKIKILEDKEFMNFLKNHIIDNKYAIIYADINEREKLDYSSNILVTETYTLEKMKKHKISWPDINIGYLTKFLEEIGEK